MRGLGGDGWRRVAGRGAPQPRGLCGPQRPKGVCSAWQDCVVPLPNSQVCSGPRPLGGSEAEKGAVPSGGRGDQREDKRGSGRFQTSISYAAQFSSQNHQAEQHVTPSRLSWWLTLATLQT